MTVLRYVVIGFAFSMWTACGDDGGGDGGACLAALELDCSPTFAPTFQAFYDNRLGTTCGGANTGVSCHSATGLQGGLNLSEPDTAYDALLGVGDAPARVEPGKPECSLLMKRLESDDPGFQMPVGGKLSEGERCAVRQWIAAGADR